MIVCSVWPKGAPTVICYFSPRPTLLALLSGGYLIPYPGVLPAEHKGCIDSTSLACRK